jgi:hypothetical protein
MNLKREELEKGSEKEKVGWVDEGKEGWLDGGEGAGGLGGRKLDEA